MARLAFDPSLRTERSPSALDFPETSFFRQNSPSKLELPTTADVRDRVGGQTMGTVAFPDLKLFVKFGPPHRVSIEEAQALQAIYRAFPNKEVPVPELVGWRAEDGVSYIYMSLIPGSTLESCWPDLTLEERTGISEQLAQILSSLRSIRQDPGTEYIGSLDHGPVKAIYFRGQTIGPFIDTAAFNNALQFWALPWLPMSQRPPDPFRHLLPDISGIFYTHADLHLDNIMIAGEPGSRRIVSIVDWGQAGWYPEFWEYYNMATETDAHEWSKQGWVQRVLTPHETECEALDNYWSWRGPP